MKCAVVPSSFLGVTKKWSPEANIGLSEAVEKHNLDPHDTESVKALWAKLIAGKDQQRLTKEVNELRARLKAKYGELHALQELFGVRRWRK